MQRPTGGNDFKQGHRGEQGRRGFARIAAILVAPVLLFGCLLTPGKFVSTMTIKADRTFACTYKGEVIAIDPGSMMKGLGDKPVAVDATPPEKGHRLMAMTNLPCAPSPRRP